jgi:hypothetical protein
MFFVSSVTILKKCQVYDARKIILPAAPLCTAVRVLQSVQYTMVRLTLPLYKPEIRHKSAVLAQPSSAFFSLQWSKSNMKVKYSTALVVIIGCCYCGEAG